MMSASLLSDMESFKAANPNGKIEDFIRWYSPRDWIESEDGDSTHKKGALSSRMLIPGNTWQIVWGNAKPVPARRQDKSVLDLLLRSYEAELIDGVKGDTSLKMLNLFSEVKRIQNELPVDEEPNNQMSLPNPSEKQFTLRLSGKTVSKGDGGPQFLRAILGQNEFS